MTDHHLPTDKQSLEELYDATIDHHEAYLDKLHAAFDKRCDVIEKQAKTELSKVDSSNEQAKQQVMQVQKERLDKIMAQLKYAINKSNANAMKRLEKIQDRIDGGGMNIEQELANLG